MIFKLHSTIFLKGGEGLLISVGFPGFRVQMVLGPSIYDVTHFLRFLSPPSPLSPILHNIRME